MAFPAHVYCLDQTNLAHTSAFPKISRRFMAVTGGFVESRFGVADRRIVASHRGPREWLQPTLNRNVHRLRFDSSLSACNSATPALFK